MAGTLPVLIPPLSRYSPFFAAPPAGAASLFAGRRSASRCDRALKHSVWVKSSRCRRERAGIHRPAPGQMAQPPAAGGARVLFSPPLLILFGRRQDTGTELAPASDVTDGADKPDDLEALLAAHTTPAGRP